MITTRRTAGGPRLALELKLAAGVLGPSLRPVVCAQVHGSRVVFVRAARGGEPLADVDGVLTDDFTAAVCVFTADCIPLFVWDADGPLFGLVHVGRRGLLQGIVEHVVSVIRLHGVPPSRVRFLLGPHVCGDCYTVGAASVAGALEGYDAVTGRFSMQRELCARLRIAGVREEQVAFTGGCTVHDRGRWYSYRAGDGDNRNLSIICRRGEGTIWW